MENNVFLKFNLFINILKKVNSYQWIEWNNTNKMFD